MANSYVRLSRKDYRILKVIFKEESLPCPKILGLLRKLRQQLDGNVDERASYIQIKLDCGNERTVYGDDPYRTIDIINIRAVKEAIKSTGVEPEETSPGLLTRFRGLFQTEVQVPR